MFVYLITIIVRPATTTYPLIVFALNCSACLAVFTLNRSTYLVSQAFLRQEDSSKYRFQLSPSKKNDPKITPSPQKKVKNKNKKMPKNSTPQNSMTQDEKKKKKEDA